MSQAGQRIRDRLLDDEEFPGDEHDRLVAAMLSTYVDEYGKSGPISVDAISRQIRLAKRTVERSLGHLQEFGIVSFDDQLTPPLTFLRYQDPKPVWGPREEQ